MLPYFPIPYEDELLYSVIARYHYTVGNRDYKDTLMEVFGARTKVPSFHFPTGIGFLCSQLPPKTGLTAERLIYKHTLLPLYLPFMPRQRANHIFEDMVYGKGNSVYAETGLMAGNDYPQGFLFYCPICVQQDEEEYGESYFRRTHNVHGISVCAEHGCRLRVYSESYRTVSRLEFIRLDYDKAVLEPEYMSDDRLYEQIKQVAESARYLLDCPQISIDQSAVHEYYLCLLKNAGFLTCRGRVKQRDLVAAFNSRYDDRLLSFLQSVPDEDNEYNWLKVATRKPRRVTSPIRHILLINFLTGGMENFFQSMHIPINPFGGPPWYCLNPVADHFRKPVITDCKVTADFKTREPVGTFSCQCGFIYSRKGPDKLPGDRYKVGTIKRFGTAWEGKLKELILDGNKSLRGIARILCCDPKTVVKYSDKLGLSHYLGSKMTIKDSRVQNVEANGGGYFEKYSEDILRFIAAEPSCCRKDVRQNLKKQYSWFYRNDRDWLEINLPPAIPKGRVDCENARIDWGARDKELLAQLVDAYTELLNSTKPVRITASRLAKMIGKRALLQRHLDKLPMTVSYLRIVCESVSDFQLRRIDAVVRELYNRKGSVKEWEIIREAGIRPEYLDGVKPRIQEHMDEIHKLVAENSVIFSLGELQ